MCVCVCVRVYVMGYIQVVCVMWCAAYVVWCVVCGVRVCVGVGVGVGVEYEWVWCVSVMFVLCVWCVQARSQGGGGGRGGRTTPPPVAHPKDFVPPFSNFVPPFSNFVPPFSNFVPPFSNFVPPFSNFVPPFSNFVPPFSNFVPPLEYVDDVTRAMSKGGCLWMSKSGGVFQIDDVTRTMSKGGGCAWCSTHPSSDPPHLAGYGPVCVWYCGARGVLCVVWVCVVLWCPVYRMILYYGVCGVAWYGVWGVVCAMCIHTWGMPVSCVYSHGNTHPLPIGYLPIRASFEGYNHGTCPKFYKYLFYIPGTCVTSQLLGEDEPGDDERRSEEALLDDNEYHDVMKRLSDYFQTQKRHLCRRYFIYNPVRGKCQPTLMVCIYDLQSLTLHLKDCFMLARWLWSLYYVRCSRCCVYFGLRFVLFFLNTLVWFSFVIACILFLQEVLFVGLKLPFQSCALLANQSQRAHAVNTWHSYCIFISAKIFSCRDDSENDQIYLCK